MPYCALSCSNCIPLLFLPPSSPARNPSNAQYFQACRKPEKALNSCVFSKLGLKKEIPGSPAGQPQINEKKWPIVTTVQK